MSNLNKEQKLIAKIKSMVGSSARFIGDDCAVLPGKMLVTTDTLVEQIHFKLDWTSLNDLGWKAMAVNLSDIAAMAGRPKYALIVLSAPEHLFKTDKIVSLYEGLSTCAKHYKTDIVGGDITRGTNLAITVTLIGQAHDAGVLMRSGAKKGDAIIVTGDFGASHAGLRLLQTAMPHTNNSQYSHCLQEFLKPMPRLEDSWQLVERIGGRGALIDTSDGLADALLQISQASGVGMSIEAQSIPIAEQTIQYASSINRDPLDFALYGGEDYQLVACLSQKEWQTWTKERNHGRFKKIGTVTETQEVQLTFGNEKVYKLDPSRIFEHIS
jgi:thiamine-monophosphate kinase